MKLLRETTFASRSAPYLGSVLSLAALAAYGLMVEPGNGARGLPCLWTLIFHHKCFGCGLTRAGAYMLRGRVQEAISMNWLILPVTALVAREIFLRLAGARKIQTQLNTTSHG